METYISPIIRFSLFVSFDILQSPITSRVKFSFIFCLGFVLVFSVSPVTMATSKLHVTLTTTTTTTTTTYPASTAAATVQRPCSCQTLLMDCSHRGKVTLSRKEMCPNAKKLNFRNNSLTSFPETFKFFDELNLSQNKLKTLPPVTLVSPSISVLKVSRNHLSGSLDPIKPLSNLEVLDVSLNRLTSLRFVPKPCNLRVLEASENSILNLDGIQTCSRLISLYVARNNIISLPTKVFSKMTELTELGLYGNPLVSLSSGIFSGLKNLKYLYLSSTNISTISYSVFSSLSELRSLYLSSNPRLTISSKLFNGLSQLTNLHIRDANIENIPEGLFSDLVKLEVLNLSKNRLKLLIPSIFDGLVSLKALDLSENLISVLPQGVFKGLNKLSTLYLENNKLREVQGSVLSDLEDLEIIELSSNILKLVPKFGSCCEKVTTMSLGNNKIASPTYLQTRSLLSRQMVLDLRSNPISLEAIFWAWDSDSVVAYVNRQNCRCGGLQLANGTMQLCFEVACGEGKEYVDWIEAARNLLF